MNGKLLVTSHNSKRVFDKILSTELAHCKYKIKASYEWKQKRQIFSLRFIDAYTVELRVNLNFAIEDVFLDSKKAVELTISYRSYFIATYLQCLESITNTIPDTLFQGIVILEAIENTHSGVTVTSYSPLFDSTSLKIRPIDIYCAIYSLKRVCTEKIGTFSQSIKERCEEAIQWMACYSRMPEIEYKKTNKPEYTVLSDLICINKLVTTMPMLLKQYPLLRQFNIWGVESPDIYSLLTNEMLNEFWIGVLIRMLAFSDNRTFFHSLTAFPKFQKGIEKLRKKSVVYIQECSITEQKSLCANMLAVKKTQMNIDLAYKENDSIKSGALHFVQ